MRLRKSVLLFCFLLSGIFVYAQDDDVPANFCGYSGFSPWLDWYQRNTGLFDRDDADTAWLYVPMTLHIVGKDEGNSYYPLDRALAAVCGMNEQYEPLRIRFYLKPGDEVRYHNNTSWYEHDWSGGSDMINTASAGIKNRLNAFIVGDPAGNCGYSWKDVIVLKKSCSGAGNTTWAHEAGHHFSLPHPFSGWEDYEWNYSKPAPKYVNGREVEKTDRSNCFTGGDRFCDTDPDYLSDRWSCTSEFRSNTVQIDPDSISFRSDATLYMGYANDACASRFTTEQQAAIRANLQDEHKHYLQITQPLTGIDDDAQVELISPVDTLTPVHYNQVEFKWNKIANAKYYVVEIGLNSKFSPILYSQTIVDGSNLVMSKSLPNNMNLYWRVKAYNGWDVCQPFDNAQIGVFHTKNLSYTNELEKTTIIELLPNPVFSGTPALLNIQSTSGMDLSLKVCDAAGRLCYQSQIQVYTGDNQFEIPTAGLSAGTYSVFLQNEKGATVKRLAILE